MIETKTWSKLDQGRAVIKFDGQTLMINGTPVGEGPVVQVHMSQFVQDAEA